MRYFLLDSKQITIYQSLIEDNVLILMMSIFINIFCYILVCSFYAPPTIVEGHYVFWSVRPFVRSFVRPSVRSFVRLFVRPSVPLQVKVFGQGSF